VVIARGRLDRFVAFSRAHWHWLIPAVVLAALLGPLATDKSFASDWGNHYWLIWKQGQEIGSLGEPSYYLQSTLGAFYPYFAFYGGSMYAALGAVSWLTSPQVALVLAHVVALVAAYLGWTWLAWMAGLRGWVMQIPGCLAATAPYAISNIYGRGDIPEMIATSMIPLVAAAGLSLLREPEVRLRSALAFTGAVAVLTGTHTLTLAWGVTFLLVCALILVITAWPVSREQVRRAWRLVWLGLLGVALNAWMLVPLVLDHTKLQEGGPDPLAFTEATDFSHLFGLFRDGSGFPDYITADINTQLPVLVLVWTVVFGAIAWATLPSPRRRLLAGLGLLFAAFLALMLESGLIEQLPTVLTYIQFPYRLLVYADLALVGAATVVLAACQRSGRGRRAPALIIAAVAAIALVQSVAQITEVRSFLPSRGDALASAETPPPTWYAPLQFADASAPVVKPTLGGELVVPAAAGGGDSYSVTVEPGRAGSIATNVLTGTYFVDVEGARPVGRTEEGRMVVELPASEQPRVVSFEAAWGAPVTVGRWITLVAIGVCVFLVSWSLAGRWGRGRRRSGAPGEEDV